MKCTIRIKTKLKSGHKAEASDFYYTIKVGKIPFKPQEFTGKISPLWEIGGHTGDFDKNAYVQVNVHYHKSNQKMFSSAASYPVTLFNKEMPMLELVVPLTKGTPQTPEDTTKKQEVKKTCPHAEDGAIAVAQYIVKEIQTNTKSSHAQSIRNSIGAYKGLEEYNKNPRPEEGGILQVNFHMKIAKGIWIERVFAGRPWDHKPKIRDNGDFNAIAVIRPLPGKPANQLSYRYWHKYKNHDYFYDVWSNMHYGYVGLSVGFDEKTLLDGASKAQKIDSKGGNSEDTPDDITSIKIGFSLFKQFGLYGDGLTTQHVLDALEEKNYSESRDKHWCKSDKNPNKIK